MSPLPLLLAHLPDPRGNYFFDLALDLIGMSAAAVCTFVDLIRDEATH